jgi:hypothetical protein
MPLPLRLLVLGPSTTMWTSFMGGPRSDFTYPRVIEEQVLRAGRPISVIVSADPGAQVRHQFRSWQVEIAPWSPDVVVLAYGHAECVHRFLPYWLQRHLQGLAARPGPWRDRYHRRVAAPTWRLLCRLQGAIDRRLPPTFLAPRSRRVPADVTRLVARLQMLGSPLVLIPEILPPGPVWTKWFPGIGARIDWVNTGLRSAIEAMSLPNVRFVDLLEVSRAAAGPDGVMNPDGGHFTPEVHRATGTALAAEILAWAETQEHLRLPV